MTGSRSNAAYGVTRSKRDQRGGEWECPLVAHGRHLPHSRQRPLSDRTACCAAARERLGAAARVATESELGAGRASRRYVRRSRVLKPAGEAHDQPCSRRTRALRRPFLARNKPSSTRQPASFVGHVGLRADLPIVGRKRLPGELLPRPTRQSITAHHKISSPRAGWKQMRAPTKDRPLDAARAGGRYRARRSARRR